MHSESKLFDLVGTYDSVFLRLALGLTFLAAVTDRFGLWGLPGTPNVAWGNLERFGTYAAILNPWAPTALIPGIVWIVTVAETWLGCALILGFRTRWSAFASGVLLLLFALGMSTGTGVKSALNASVFSASAAAFALSIRHVSVWSIDALRQTRSRPG
jgi:thiosulfate dehydrogenase [quinone] large subunit